MKIITYFFIFLLPLFFLQSCSKEDTTQQVPTLSDVIVGQWHYTQYMGWPEKPWDEWHVQEDSILVIHFKSNRAVVYRFINSGNLETGTYEVIDSSSTIEIDLESTFPFDFRISEFTEDMLIREYQTDEGFVHERYDKLK